MENSLMKSTLPETGFVRLPHIIGDAKAQPPIPAIIPVSKSTWWAGVKRIKNTALPTKNERTSNTEKSWVQKPATRFADPYPKAETMDIENKLKIVANYHQRLAVRHKELGKAIAQLTAAGCINAREYWKDGKYLYLLYAMTNGVRKKKYVGNHPLRIEEAQQKLANYKQRQALITTQETIRSEMDEIERSQPGCCSSARSTIFRPDLPLWVQNPAPAELILYPSEE